MLAQSCAGRRLGAGLALARVLRHSPRTVLFTHRCTLHASLRGLGLLFAIASTQSRALAHGPPPAAVSVVMEDALGQPSVVRLTAGLALRGPGEFFHMLCPALWNDNAMLPALAHSGGPAVVLSSSGLYLLTRDGSIAPHPDPNATGPSIDIVELGGQLFVLRATTNASEIVRVTPERVEVVFHDAQIWTALAAGDSRLFLARLGSDDHLHQATLSTKGELLGSDSAGAPPGAISVSAKTLGDEPYLVVPFNGGRDIGQVEAGQFIVLQTASANIAGPIAADSGRAFIAIDTALASLSDQQLSLLSAADPSTPIACLGRYAGKAYACTREGLRTLNDDGLGGSIFELSKLLGPVLDGLDPTTRDRCDTQWQHFRFDLLSLGIPLAEDMPAATFTSAAGSGGGGLAAAGTAAGSGSSASGASDGGAAGSVRTAPTSAGGCHCAVNGARDEGRLGSLTALSMLLALSWRRRAARARRAQPAQPQGNGCEC